VNVARVRSDGVGELETSTEKKSGGDNQGYGFMTVDYFAKKNVVVRNVSL
jgi:hypothetical protein